MRYHGFKRSAKELGSSKSTFYRIKELRQNSVTVKQVVVVSVSIFAIVTTHLTSVASAGWERGVSKVQCSERYM